MRRTIFLALLAALMLVPATAHAAGPEEILRDCADDGILQGDYSASEMRSARNNIPAELEEYSDCRDVLSRAIAAKTAASNNNGNSNDSSGAGGGGAGDGGAGGAADPSATVAPDPAATPSGRDPGVVTGPSTPQDWKAIEGAMQHGSGDVAINGRKISPAASVGRNGLPGTVIAVLALIAVAAIAVTVPFVRRRVVARPIA